MKNQLSLFDAPDEMKDQAYWDEVQARHIANLGHAKKQAKITLNIFHRQFPEHKHIRLRPMLGYLHQFRYGGKYRVPTEPLSLEGLTSLIAILQDKPKRFLNFLGKENNEQKAGNIQV